jgi:hypothetical protein
MLPLLFACCYLQVRVLCAFDAEAKGELSVAVGDLLWVEAEAVGITLLRRRRCLCTICIGTANRSV